MEGRVAVEVGSFSLGNVRILSGRLLSTSCILQLVCSEGYPGLRSNTALFICLFPALFWRRFKVAAHPGKSIYCLCQGRGWVPFSAQAGWPGGSGPSGRPQHHLDAIGEDTLEQLCRGFCSNTGCCTPHRIFQFIRSRATLLFSC